jgi:hypothetical protein
MIAASLDEDQGQKPARRIRGILGDAHYGDTPSHGAHRNAIGFSDWRATTLPTSSYVGLGDLGRR